MPPRHSINVGRSISSIASADELAVAVEERRTGAASSAPRGVTERGMEIFTAAASPSGEKVEEEEVILCLKIENRVLCCFVRGL